MCIVKRDANSVVTLDSSYSRDAAGRILSLDGPNARDDWTFPARRMAPGVHHSKRLTGSFRPASPDRSSPYANGAPTTFTYSPTRRWLTRIVTRDANSVVTLDSSYTRDNAGRILAIDGLNARDDWTFPARRMAPGVPRSN